MVYVNNTLYFYSDTTGLISSFPFPNPFTIPTQRDSIQASRTFEGQRNIFFRGSRQGASYLGFLTRFYNLPSEKYAVRTLLFFVVAIFFSKVSPVSQIASTYWKLHGDGNQRMNLTALCFLLTLPLFLC
jgi:hypothetical protein